jgi:hypothetical protein
MGRDRQFFNDKKNGMNSKVYDNQITDVLSKAAQKPLWVFIESKFACGFLNLYQVKDRQTKRIIVFCSNASEDDKSYDFESLASKAIQGGKGDLAFFLGDKLLVDSLAKGGSPRIKYSRPGLALLPFLKKK